MVLSSDQIRCRHILDPFREKYRLAGVSGGLSIASYDVAIDQDIKFGPRDFKLASTVERFTMPIDICGMVHDKSTWARIGLTVQTTFIDPGWCGHLTLEISNNTDKIICVDKDTPIAQIVFHQILLPSGAYEGKYQNQKRGPQEPILCRGICGGNCK
jgi:dCTP deaminase